jgi:hypothetical protein
MNNLCAILHHLFARIFYVTTRTTIACGIANQLNLGVFVYAESPFPVPHGAEALPARTTSVAIADNYANLRLCIHFSSFQYSFG